MRLKRNRLLEASSILAFLGIIDSIYLTLVRYANSSPICTVNEQCQMVLTSRFSAVGHIPLSLIGIFYYSSVFVISIYLIRRYNKDVLSFLFLITFCGLIVSMFLISVQALILGAFCQYCLFSEAVSMILFFIILKMKRNTR
ncbi:MAG: hypothetical protein A2152_02955 [Candidatus Levybacteria bacterium RBG_16_35_6]|nr:MAG: hypothetical protein A2152_02955 [Candidatus Levybacteria bacterium RBG_16_35_6]